MHCITNAVAQNFTANMLLAAGAVPSMTLAPKEIGEFVARADALLVNLGTFDPERRKASTRRDRRSPTSAGMPWVLDPVFIDRSPPRAAFAKKLVAQKPRACGSIARSSPRWPAASRRRGAGALCAQARRPWSALTGERDLVTDGARLATIANGHPLMARVTAMGCAASALVGAFSRGRGRRLAGDRGGADRVSASRARSRPSARAGPAASPSESSMRCTRSTATRCAQGQR